MYGRAGLNRLFCGAGDVAWPSTVDAFLEFCSMGLALSCDRVADGSSGEIDVCVPGVTKLESLSRPMSIASTATPDNIPAPSTIVIVGQRQER